MRKFIAIILVAAFALVGCGVGSSPFSEINADDYYDVLVAVMSSGLDLIRSFEEEHIELAVEFLNSIETTGTPVPYNDTAHPFAGIRLARNDGAATRVIDFHGMSEELNTFRIRYNGFEYRVRNPARVYEDLKNLRITLGPCLRTPIYWEAYIYGQTNN